MKRHESALETLARISRVNADFGAVAGETTDFMVRVGESMLKVQSVDLAAAHSAFSGLVEQGDRLTTAFRALGQSKSLQAQNLIRRECEDSMLAFAAALARVKGSEA